MLCKICGSPIVEAVKYLVRDWRFQPDAEYTYRQCRVCACLQIAEIPHDLDRQYPPLYDSFRWSPPRPGFVSLAHRLRGRYAVFDRGLIGKLLYARFPDPSLRSLAALKLTRQSRVLDVGCGTGKIIYWLRELGFKNVLGVDRYLSAPITYSNGLHILKGDLSAVGGEWDVIMLHHVFEHLPNPLEILHRIGSMLTPGGLCLIRTPIVPSYAWERYGVYWVQWDAPRHLFIHSRESLRLLAVQAGFDLIRTVDDSTAFQCWGSEQYEKGIPLESAASYFNNRRAFNASRIAGFERLARQLNAQKRGDQAAFYLQKRRPDQPAARTRI
jgi:SAM-dependent methyltransferase